jgi:hypothetical protein
MTLTLTLHTADGPMTFVGSLQNGHDSHPYLRFSGLSGDSDSLYFKGLHGLLGLNVRLDDLASALDRAGFERDLSR